MIVEILEVLRLGGLGLGFGVGGLGDLGGCAEERREGRRREGV